MQRPNTAYDMIGRLPGFTFDDGNTARGFAGTAGNVLIDGQRPTSKSDDLQSILQRIPASDVDHIEVIRGGAPGIDMQGQTVIANVIRKKGSVHAVGARRCGQFLHGRSHRPEREPEVHRAQRGPAPTKRRHTRYASYDNSVGKGIHNDHGRPDRQTS